MKLINIGKILRQHGVKGGMKVSSDFKYKKEAFKVGNTIYVLDKPYKITSYSYAGGGQADICYLEGINTIDDVIAIKQNTIYIDKDSLNIKEILDEELLNMEVYLNSELIGTVYDIQTGINPLIMVKYNGKNVYIPRQDIYIKNIDVDNNKIELTEDARGLL